ncbi:MAG TPA: hypothetical protein ENI12_07035 [Nitrospirae bacterium]|nr:hypothetical protein [Nitrospirota bacterium]
MVGKAEKGCYGGGKEAVNKQLQEEDRREAEATVDARLLTRKLLLENGFFDVEIQEDASLIAHTSRGDESVSIDFLISVDGSPLMIVKCSMALESRERHVIALARAAFDIPPPLCAITDGLVTRVYRTASGSMFSELKEDFPSRARLLAEAAQIKPEPVSKKRREMETMILMAFEAASCPRVPDRINDGEGSNK